MEKRISQVARELGLHPNTLRGLEQRGLIHPIRTLSGYRIFTEDLVQKIQKIYAERQGNR